MRQREPFVGFNLKIAAGLRDRRANQCAWDLMTSWNL